MAEKIWSFYGKRSRFFLSKKAADGFKDMYAID